MGIYQGRSIIKREADGNRMEIRKPTLEDLEEVSPLLTQLGYPSQDSSLSSRMRAHAEDPASVLFIAEVEEGVAGLIAFHLIPLIHADGYLGRITALVVGEAFRRKGIARKLMETVEDWGRQRGCTRFEVTTNEKRLDAHAFYQTSGYRISSKRFYKE